MVFRQMNSLKSSALAATFAALAGTCLAESPREFARRFCSSEHAFGRGVPSGTTESGYDHLVGIEMIRAIRNANDALEQWARRHRNSKETLMIPHIEGNLFSGFSDGPTTCRIGTVGKSASGKVSVAINRRYREGAVVREWTDVLILDQDPSGWVAYDLRTHHYGSLLACFDEFRESVDSSGERFRP
jgi:hypothetical protein